MGQRMGYKNKGTIMKRTVAAFVFCLLHLAFIILPEVQLWPHLSTIATNHKLIEVNSIKSTESPRVGDIMYVKAITERAKSTNDAKEKSTVPETTISHTGLIYLLTSETVNQLLLSRKVNRFIDFQEQTHCGIKEDTSPPPQFTSC